MTEGGEITIRSFHNLTPELKSVALSCSHHVQLLLSFCSLSIQFHQRMMSVNAYPGNRELRSVCVDFCYDMRSLLMDTAEALSSQRSIAFSLQTCCKYIDFYRIHYVLRYPTEYLYQYYIASFIQVREDVTVSFRTTSFRTPTRRSTIASSHRLRTSTSPPSSPT